MAKKFNDQYRIPSARLQTWDYGWAGAYFITICTHQQTNYFGDIKNGKMQLSPTGAIANVFWYEIKNRIKPIELGEFVVMPNHIHGILIINNVAVETGHALSLPPPPLTRSPSPSKPPQSPKPTNEKTIGQNRFQNIGKNSISSIVGGYKSAVTKHANRLGFEFKWQRLFHDHIIRNEQSFHNISGYIINNPGKWEEDKFYQKNNDRLKHHIEDLEPRRRAP